MMNDPKQVFERVYIHAAKVRVKEGRALLLCAMDAHSQFAFEPVFSKTPRVTIEVLNQLFDNILKNYHPVFHPLQIVFITNLPEAYSQLFQQTKAANHRFVYNSDITRKAMKVLLDSFRFKIVEL